MFKIVGRSEERSEPTFAQEVAPKHPYVEASEGFELLMQQNRSSFTQEARLALSVLVTLFMVTAILPFVQGQFLVAFYSLGVLALLVWALDHHRQSPPLTERLSLSDGEIRYWNSRGRQFALSCHWIRFEAHRPTPSEVRLVLRNRDQHFEVGHSLSLDERNAVAPIIASALSASRGG